MHLHLNPLGGLAGDMFGAALLHARPALLASAQEVLATLPMAVGVNLALAETAGPVRGRRLLVRPQSGMEGHRHARYAEIRTLLEDADLPAGAQRLALDIFRRLAEAEGRVHGVAADAVSFHEVGAWDSIADVVVAAFLIDALGVRSSSTAPLPLGGGRVPSAHGMLPVPAPATALLLEGLPVFDDGIPGERVTPTGAAILQALGPAPSTMPAGTLLGSGLGFGSRTLPGIPNCLQVLLCDPESRGVAPSSSGSGFRPDADRVTVLRFEVDDQSPEEFAQGQDALRRAPGVLSVTAFPGLGKKGRPTFGVEVLAQPASALAAVDACFRETTTLGLRWQDCGRWVLRRRTEHVDTPAGRLEVKLAVRPDGVAVKAGADQVAAIPGHRARVDARRRAEQEALRQETHGD